MTRQMTYEEVMELPTGTKVMYKNPDGIVVEAEVYAKDAWETDKAGKLRYPSKFKDKHGDVRYNYVNIFNKPETNVFEIQ